MNRSTTGPDGNAAARLLHGEYKIPGGKLVVVDLRVADGRLRDVQLSGDFFMEPPETLEAINAALDGMLVGTGAQGIEQAVQAVLGPEVMLYGLTPEGIAVVVERALS